MKDIKNEIKDKDKANEGKYINKVYYNSSNNKPYNTQDIKNNNEIREIKDIKYPKKKNSNSNIGNNIGFVSSNVSTNKNEINKEKKK